MNNQAVSERGWNIETWDQTRERDIEVKFRYLADFQDI